MIYYVNSECKSLNNDGLTPEKPLQSIEGVEFIAGDTVLFKRGTTVKAPLFLQSGEINKPITYGAYGDGENPIVNNSVLASAPEQWYEEYPDIWKFKGDLPSEICNIVFDDGKSFGNLRWDISELKNQGEWYCDVLGFSMCDLPHNGNGSVYLFSKGNPSDLYSLIELAVWGKGRLVTAQHDVVIENIIFEKSGVHGFAATRAERIEIKNCKFRCIGGGVFDLKNKIRLGNAIEFWNGAKDCLVENCVFEDIYDTGVTHQGNCESQVPERLFFRYNTFIRCGLAAYEWRGPSSKDIVFEHNKCIQAGGAFTMQGEDKPRRTETFEKIKACVFILMWLKEAAPPQGSNLCSIRNNKFYLDDGSIAAIWSTIKKTDNKYIIIDENTYICKPEQVITHFENKTYSADEYRTYQEEIGFDKASDFHF